MLRPLTPYIVAFVGLQTGNVTIAGLEAHNGENTNI